MSGWKKILLNMMVFQVGWFVCILGGNEWAFLYTVIAISIHLYFFSRAFSEVWVIIAVTVLGCSWDSMLLYFGVFSFDADGYFIPVWLGCLWLLFSCTLNHSLAWLKGKYIVAAIFGAVFAPASYFAGVQMSGAMFVMPLALSLSVIALGWAFIFPLGMHLVSGLSDE